MRGKKPLFSFDRSIDRRQCGGRKIGIMEKGIERVSSGYRDGEWEGRWKRKGRKGRGRKNKRRAVEQSSGSQTERYGQRPHTASPLFFYFHACWCSPSDWGFISKMPSAPLFWQTRVGRIIFWLDDLTILQTSYLINLAQYFSDGLRYSLLLLQMFHIYMTF